MKRDDEDRQLLRDTARRFATREVTPHVEALNHYPAAPLPAGMLEKMIAQMRELGFLDLVQSLDPKEGADLAALSAVLETLAEAAAAPAATLFAHCLAQRLLAEAGPRSGNGKSASAETPLLAYPAYGEPAATDAVASCRATGDGYLLEGTCEFVVNAPVADTLVLPVAREGAGRGVALIAVPRETEGLRIGEPLLTLGMRGSPVADVVATGARIRAEQVVAEPPRAAEVIDSVSRQLRGPAAAVATGILACSARAATEYARERYQGGSSIIEHQQVRSMLADMVADYALCREATERLSAGGEIFAPAATSLFLRAKERAAHATCDGVQLLGGYGYMEDYCQERCMRDAKQAQCLLGRCDALRQELTADWLAADASL
jgi:alkylation response protein AidB-like acyl-CoA dehydrogenase